MLITGDGSTARTLSADDFSDVFRTRHRYALGHVSAASWPAAVDAVRAVHQRHSARARLRPGGQSEPAEPGDDEAGAVVVGRRRQRLVAGEVGD